MSSRPHGRSKKGHKSHPSRSPSPAQSDSSDAELDQDEEHTPLRYGPVSPAQWTHSRHSTHSSINTRLQLPSPLSPAPNEPQPEPSYINRMPPELLIHIFRQITDIRDLYHCILVSSTWCQCTVELLWLKPQITSLQALAAFLRVIRPGIAKKQQDRNGEGSFNSNEVVADGQPTDRADITRSNSTRRHLEDPALQKEPDPFFPYARFVRRLNLSSLGEDLRDTYFRELANCVRMERLTLNSCANLTDDSLSIISNMPNLVALDLTGVVDVTDATILNVTQSSKRIQGLNLEGCKKITDAGINAIAEHAPLLRRIKLCELDQITGQSISNLVQKCPLLIEIDLTGCVHVTDAAVRDIWQHSVHLRELRLGNCTQVGEIAFPIPPRASTTQASTSNPTPEFASFAFTTLQPLVLSRPLSHLRQIDLMSLRITDEAVAGIIANAPKLRYLVLAKCGLLTDRAMRSISELGKQLQFLHLGHANAITDEGIRKLARSCTRLRYVDLACCTSLTNESVRYLCALPKLRRIGLVRVPNLTDEAVEHLTGRANTLERVHLSYCERISVGAIHNLLQKLTKLTHLSLTGVPAFMRKDLQKFCRTAPANFTNLQRQAFCVYSGHGIHQLRSYLERNIHGPQGLSDDEDFSQIGSGLAVVDVQLSETDDDNREEGTVTDHPPAQGHSSNSAQHIDYLNGIHEELTELARHHQNRAMAEGQGRGGSGRLHSISRSQASAGTSRQNSSTPVDTLASLLFHTPGARRTPRVASPSTSGSTTPPTAYAGMLSHTPSPTGTSNGIRHRNMAGSIVSPVAGTFMVSRMQPSSAREGSGAMATTATTSASEVRWRGLPLHRMGGSTSGYSGPSGSNSSPNTRSHPGQGSSTGEAALDGEGGVHGNGIETGETSFTSECSYEEEQQLQLQQHQQQPSSLTRPASGSRRLKSPRAHDPNRGTSRQRSYTNPESQLFPSATTEHANYDGLLELRTSTPSPSPSPGAMSNGRVRRGIKGTLSAAEQFTVSLFKGKGRREGSASPGPGLGNGSTSPRLETER